MRGFFGLKTKVLNSYTIGKAEKKKLNAQYNLKMDAKAEYKIYLLENRASLVKQQGESLFFILNGNVFPTLKKFNKETTKFISIDAGALGPLMRGADVMAPGIIKYAAMNPEFEKDEVVGVDIIGKGITAVGVTTISSSEMRASKEGVVVDILHLEGDALDTQKL